MFLQKQKLESEPDSIHLYEGTYHKRLGTRETIQGGRRGLSVNGRDPLLLLSRRSLSADGERASLILLTLAGRKIAVSDGATIFVAIDLQRY
jgi:hypothetical protein